MKTRTHPWVKPDYLKHPDPDVNERRRLGMVEYELDELARTCRRLDREAALKSKPKPKPSAS